MKITRNGKFSHTFDNLSRGLRKTDDNISNSDYMISCNGAIVKDNLLQTLEILSRLDTSVVGGTFPYPQLFVFTNLIICCNQTEIYEYENSLFTLKFTGGIGSTWDAVAFHDFVYLSNGNNKVVRDPDSKIYSESADLPAFMAVCNFNGQVIIGSPNAGYI